MKKIVLSLGMLIAVATASYAQQNTATLDQNLGQRNDANINQVGQLQQATVSQTGAVSTTDNKAVIDQQGKGNVAQIIELGKGNDVTITQNNVSFPSSTHTALIQVVNDLSDLNVMRIDQTGKKAVGQIFMNGDKNQVTFTQGGDENQAFYQGAAGNNTNDENVIQITQLGRKNQSFALTEGDKNQITVSQNGNDNMIGMATGGAQPLAGVGFNRVRAANSLSTNGGDPGFNANATRPIGGLTPNSVVNTSVIVDAGINILGDRNIVQVTQDQGTRNNQAGVSIGRTGGPNPPGTDADDNTVTIVQSGTARDNQAAVQIVPGADLNTGAINQTGTARGNSAGILFEGDNDMSTINQSGDFNMAITVQRASTVSGANIATIDQPGNNNTAYIQQDGINGSMGTITQNTNGNYAELYQSTNGGHSAVLIQNVIVPGSRLILDQVGTGNSAYLVQGQGAVIGVPTDVEIQQTGVGNQANGISNGSQRTVQTGNYNVASY